MLEVEPDYIFEALTTLGLITLLFGCYVGLCLLWARYWDKED